VRIVSGLERLGAAEAVRRISRREISAEELLRDCLERIEQREPAVRAWETVGRAPRPAGDSPLHGLPVGVKDIIDTADFPTAYGSPIFRGHRPGADAACVEALKRAGAVILGKTVTTEFAVYAPGKTRNPHDPSRTPGGSSSGSAAAVADFMVPAALGTQTAGSLIRPASFCGAIGWKPSFGTLSMQGVRPIAPSLDTLGFFVREIEDVPLLMTALGAPLRLRELAPRLGFCRTEQWPLCQTKELTESAAKKLGAEEVLLGASFAGLMEAQVAVMGAEAAQSIREDPAQLSPQLRELLRAGASVTPQSLQAARAQAEICRREIEAVFARFDALVTPAATGEAPGIESTGDPAFSRIWTLLGTPCISLPLLQGPAGLPIGLQLIGPRREDERLLAAAAWVWRAKGGRAWTA
jgi:Asp-tRNA(Asn)/Glu-tRNA(Gln) amidotransferase A subunit family amidase